jgi:ribosomal 50S subunit-recycling heat shock protein
MNAMTMPFEVADLKLSKGIKVGDHIRFTITQKGDFWPITAIKRLHVKKPEAKAVPAALPKPSPTMNMPM